MNTFRLSLLALAGSLALAPVAFAADELNVSTGLTATGKPLAVHGTDTVALLTHGKATEGLGHFTATHGGVDYYFASAANRDLFAANPDKYLVQNGGFCTFGVSVGKKFDGDPRYASIVDGKLYLFLNQEIFAMYEKDRAGVIAKAAANWPKIQHSAAASL